MPGSSSLRPGIGLTWLMEGLFFLTSVAVILKISFKTAFNDLPLETQKGPGPERSYFKTLVF